MTEPLKTFICYAHEDHDIVEGLKKHLAIFEKKSLLQIWSDGKILAGEHWDKSIKTQLERAEIILLFVSVDFINSEYIEKPELQAALQRHRDGEATLIPIIVRPCHWEEYFDIGQFQALPAKARPILSSHFPHRDEALFEIAAGIKARAEEIVARKIASAARAEAEAAAQKEAEEKAAQQTAAAKLLRSKGEAAWKTAVELDTLEAYESYLEKYDLHEAEAHERIAALEAEEAKRRAAEKVRQKAEEAERMRKEEEAKAVAKAKAAKEAAEKKKREEAQRDADRSLQDDKKNDPFADLMIPIKGGTFDMGDTFGDGSESEKPIHRVTVKDFHLCKYPVTQAQWKAIMGDNPSYFKGDDLPVEQVSWEDVQGFIKKLNEKTGKKYRLPAETEWEYAAREGGRKVRFGNGKDIADPKEMNFDASRKYKKDYSKAGEFRGETTAVATFTPNALGLHDMSGKVWEWCADHWHENYKGAPDDGSAWVSGGDSSRRVIRGGSWSSTPDDCRAAFRLWNSSDDQFNNLGFRLAR